MCAESSQKQSLEIRRIELPTDFAIGPVNVYVIEDNETKILVDCGPRMPKAEAALLSGLRELSLLPEDFTGLVLTHGHIDHVGLSSLFQRSGVPIYAHPQVGSWLDLDSTGERFRQAFLNHLYWEMGMPAEDHQRAMDEILSFRQWGDKATVDVPLVPGLVFPPLPAFRVLHVPGHAQAAIALWNEQTGDLIAGDQILPNVSSNALIEPILGGTVPEEAPRTKSLMQYRDNLQALSRLPIIRVWPGHGLPFTNVHPLLERRLAHQEKRRGQVLALLERTETDEGPQSAFDLALKFFPNYRHQAGLILSEILGFLDWLEAEGEAHSTKAQDGVVLWSAQMK